jgi:hypothetical protein
MRGALLFKGLREEFFQWNQKLKFSFLGSCIWLRLSDLITIQGFSDNRRFALKLLIPRNLWSGREDSNLRPPGPEPGALPG